MLLILNLFNMLNLLNMQAHTFCGNASDAARGRAGTALLVHLFQAHSFSEMFLNWR